ncbi:MAG: 30S ribosomal protein S16 [Patescibacteria group bacterium]
MLKIRLQRIGRKNDPSFRVLVTDSRNPAKRGRYIELLGTFNPHKDAPILNAERVQYWISKGAQPSITVHNMLISGGVTSGKKINALPKKTVLKKDLPAHAGEPAPIVEAPSPASAEAVPEEAPTPEVVSEQAQVAEETPVA